MKPNSVVMTILVSDYDKALSFYVDRLGMFEVVADTKTSEMSRYVCIALREFVDHFLIHLKAPVSPADAMHVGCQAGDDVMLTLPVDDIERKHFECLTKGISIDPEISWAPYGGGACIIDPFGNRLALFQRYVSRFT